MRNLQGRFFRLTIALMLAFLVASQVPVTGVVALAQNGYPSDDDDDGNDTGKAIFITAGVAAIGYGVYYLTTQRHGGGGGGGTTIPATSEGLGAWNVADKTNNLKQFANLADKAALKGTLNGVGPYTVFAPTNSAFGAMDSRVLQDLQADENRAKLADVIGFHVIKGSYTIEQLKAEAARAGASGFPLTTITGKTVTITNEGGLKVNGVSIAESDIAATNAVLHPISSVLIPQ